MRLKQYLTELALKKAAVGVSKSTSEEFTAIIQVKPERAEGFDLFFFNANLVRSRFLLGYELDMPQEDTRRGSGYDRISDMLGKIWVITFESEKGEMMQVPTNRNLALQVFAGVEEAFKLFVKKYNPNVFYFVSVAAETSRVKLYKFLASKIARKNYMYIYFKSSDKHVWIFGSKRDVLMYPTFEEIVNADISGYAEIKGA